MVALSSYMVNSREGNLAGLTPPSLDLHDGFRILFLGLLDRKSAKDHENVI